MSKRALICLMIALLVSGCSKAASSTKSTPVVSATETISAVSSPMPAARPSLTVVTPTISVSPTPFTSFTVKSGVDNLKVRVNPGYLFEAAMMVQQTDELTVLGTAPGNEWTYVKTPTGTEGWVFTELLQSNVDLSQLPVHEPSNVLVIKGQVVDVSGQPIQGVGFDVNQGTTGQGSTNSVVTDANGVFYSFVPDTSSGTWTVSYTSIACKSNVWEDASCKKYKAGYTGSVDPLTQTVTLPQGSNQLSFTWR